MAIDRGENRPRNPDYLATGNNFNALSVRDLIEARDLYHLHLSHKKNVIATAIGLYRIRCEDPYPTSPMSPGPSARAYAPPVKKGKRTLNNSEVREYSWPCVLVFVEEWVDVDQFGAAGSGVLPEDIVPRTLYMPDGRVVPVCVIEAPIDESAEGPIGNLAFPQNLLGGGYPVLVEVQGEDHVASVGCLVTDGHLVYALTNRHVAGETAEVVYTVSGGKRVAIGKTSRKQLSRLPFQEVYADWPGKNVFVNMDIGLIEVDDKTRWTAQIFGIGTMGKLADLSIDNISLKLIGSPVIAYGAASRRMTGEIQGLFYRYKSVGGFEHVADFLIGPRKGQKFGTHHGDSGTVWLLDPQDGAPEAKPNTATRPKRRGEKLAPDSHVDSQVDDATRTDVVPPAPIAVQWGGHVFLGGDGRSKAAYALATCLSTVCNLLAVDPIRDWNIGLPDFWGAVGHYLIANKACDAIANAKLRELMRANLERITFDAGDISKKHLQGLSNQAFVPLADVPDLVWKRGHFNRGNPEHPNHFADMDKPGPDGQTLLQICKGEPKKVAVDVWLQYYQSVGDTSQGLLPFRVWQFYKGMEAFVKGGDAARFVCAAGILSHYVGDACQPLHISYMFDGDPDDMVEVQQKNRQTGAFETVRVPRAKGVHATYEDGMVDRHTPEIMSGVDTKLGGIGGLPKVGNGHDAAVAVVDLMQRTFDTISPRDIIDAFNSASGQGPAAIADALWSQFGDPTIEVIATGSRYLALIWDAAWKAGGGDQTIHDLSAIDESTLSDLYQDRTFLPSRTLDKIGPMLS